MFIRTREFVCRLAGIGICYGWEMGREPLRENAMVGTPLVEHFPVADTYATGLGRIDTIGKNLRFTFYSLQHLAGGTADEFERVIVARLVLEKDAVTSAAVLALAATGTSVNAEKH